MAVGLSTASQNAMCNALVDSCDSGGAGSIEVYTAPRPATANDAPTGATLLATFTLAATAYGSAASGVATLAGTPLTTTGDAAGTAAWYRVKSGGGATVYDGSCGTSGADLNLNTTTISVGVNVEITSGTFTQPAS